MKRFLLVIIHFFAETKKTKSETARSDARLYASEPGIIPIASARRAGIFSNPGQTHFASTSDTHGKAERA